jgi:hypothetical protein
VSEHFVRLRETASGWWVAWCECGKYRSKRPHGYIGNAQRAAEEHVKAKGGTVR